jgi:uncharacterized protein (DUF488 family)
MPGTIFTLGHSTLEPEPFANLCHGAGINAIADIRSVPYSKRVPHHNRESIEQYLHRFQIAYVYLGHLLGGRPSRPSLFLPSGRADYRSMRISPEFVEGLERLRKGLEKFNIGLMCGEEDPITCHRALLIAPALAKIGLAPAHVRKGGRLESHQQFEDRLMEAAGIGASQGDLFENRDALVDRSIEAMADRHAFRLGAPEPQPSE